MKILFVYHHLYPEFWRDGLWAALRLISEKYELVLCNLAEETPDYTGFDFLLGWGAFGSPTDLCLKQAPRNIRRGLCIAGNAIRPTKEMVDRYDVIFYETDYIYNSMLAGFDTEKYV